MIDASAYIDKTAIVSESAVIGKNSKIWHYSHIRDNARLGDDCIVGDFVYIDRDVHIGSKVKIQNSCIIYRGVKIEDGVFLGPGVVFTNDKYPRATNTEGTLATDKDWKITETRICSGASVGANCTILPGITIGKFSMIGSGSVVTKDVPDFTLVLGNPARKISSVCRCGKPLEESIAKCPICHFSKS